MFECVELMITQLIDCVPYFIGLFLIFNFIGSLLFGKDR